MQHTLKEYENQKAMDVLLESKFINIEENLIARFCKAKQTSHEM